jgi:amino acid transporter
MIVLMATSSREAFMTNLASLAGVDYKATIDEAVAQGFVSNAPFDWTSTINSMVWPWFMFPFAVQSVFFAGEIKDIRKSELIGIVGSTTFSIVMCLLIWYLSLSTFGYEFLGAVGWTGAFPVFPFLNVLAALLTRNPVVSAIVAASLILWPYGWFFTGLLPGSRSMFAWGIDRVVPEAVTKVSAKWHTPTVSYGLSVVIALIFLAGITFTPYFGALSGMVGFGLCYIVAGISGILFPYVLKDIYNRSPAKIQVGRLPLVTLCGIVTLISSAYLSYRTIVDDFAFANNPMSLATIAAIFVLGFAIWIGAYFIRKSQGIDILAAYRELPIE